ncbi:post-GPI attachment to proteins factor 2 isoform X2 [Drosophila grimshawi]|uniref:post-GPI attachment to proteins factor 2 isoform X2 n=1 Tax=Drosophila grimshawi TaxID=7222 RepID=UPI000C870539|nr:post-GPI attachment to proteins factor 2 isoform X2 [Drosophila grimshawi]
MFDDRKLLPITVNDLRHTCTCRLRISMAKLLLIGFVHPPTCMVYSIIKVMISDLEGSTLTHCNVLNIVPSLSAVIRAEQSLYFKRRLPRSARLLRHLTVGLLIQNSLSCFPLAHLGHIAGPAAIHALIALSVMLSGFGYMGTSLLCHQRFRREHMEPHEKLSLMLKRKLFLTSLGIQLVMWPLFMLHNQLCIPLVYSLFSLCEYLLNLSIMGFLCTASLDFYPVYLCRHAQLGYYLTDI